MRLKKTMNKLKRKKKIFIITYKAGVYTTVWNYVVIAKDKISALKKFNKEIWYEKFLSIEEKVD